MDGYLTWTATYTWTTTYIAFPHRTRIVGKGG